MPRKPQKARMKRAACPSCGYTVRLTRKWLDVATPTCPNAACNQRGQPMATEA